MPENPWPTDSSQLARTTVNPALALSILAPLSLFISLVVSVSAGSTRELLFPLGLETDIAISLGAGFGIVSLAAFWASLGPFRLLTRIPLALLLCILAATTMTSVMINTSLGGADWGLILVLWSAVILQWVVGTLSLAVWRRLVRLRIDHPEQTPMSGKQAAQFGIQQMLIWITGVGLTLGAMRLVFSQWEGAEPVSRDLARLATVFGLLLIFNLAIALPWLFALLGRSGVLLWLLGAVVLVVVQTLLEYQVFRFMLPSTGADSVFWWLNGTAALVLAWNLLLVRLCGYRLVSEERGAPGT